MGLFKQIKATLSYQSRKLGDAMESPEVTVDNAINDMTKQVAATQAAVASAVADTKQLEIRLAAAQAEATKWGDRASLALDKSDEDLARQALEKKLAVDAKAAELADQHQSQKASTDKLKATLGEMRSNLENIKRQRNVLEARMKTAQAQTQMGAAAAARTGTENPDQLGALLDKVERLEAEADAAMEVAGHSPGDTDLDAKFADLEKGDSVEAALEQLKAQRSAD